jgi:hypothetical protein
VRSHGDVSLACRATRCRCGGTLRRPQLCACRCERADCRLRCAAATDGHVAITRPDTVATATATFAARLPALPDASSTNGNTAPARPARESASNVIDEATTIPSTDNGSAPPSTEIRRARSGTATGAGGARLRPGRRCGHHRRAGRGGRRQRRPCRFAGRPVGVSRLRVRAPGGRLGLGGVGAGHPGGRGGRRERRQRPVRSGRRWAVLLHLPVRRLRRQRAAALLGAADRAADRRMANRPQRRAVRLAGPQHRCPQDRVAAAWLALQYHGPLPTDQAPGRIASYARPGIRRSPSTTTSRCPRRAPVQECRRWLVALPVRPPHPSRHRRAQQQADRDRSRLLLHPTLGLRPRLVARPAHPARPDLASSPHPGVRPGADQPGRPRHRRAESVDVASARRLRHRTGRPARPGEPTDIVVQAPEVPQHAHDLSAGGCRDGGQPDTGDPHAGPTATSCSTSRPAPTPRPPTPSASRCAGASSPAPPAAPRSASR